MIELVRDLRVINVLAKFENDPWKITDMRVLMGACLPCRPPAWATTIPQSPQGLRGNKTSFDTCRVAIVIVVQISFEPTQTISVSSVLLSFAHLHNTLSCYIDGLVQDCSNSIALAMELMQSCTKP